MVGRQDKVFKYIDEKRNIFITGKAGTGKTTLLRDICKRFSECKINYVVLAPTGIAARNAGGVTLHSFFGLPTIPYVPNSNNRKLYTLSTEEVLLLKKVEVILIDEMSMVRCDVLDAISDVLKTYLDSDLPFGGKQLIMFGDLYQLPPVIKEVDVPIFSGEVYDTPFFFGSKELQNAGYVTLLLSTVFRQKNSLLLSILNNIRVGAVTDLDLRILNDRYCCLADVKCIEDYTILTTHKWKVRNYNIKELYKIDEPEFNYKAIKVDYYPNEDFPTDYYLKLKKGAKVIFVCNDNLNKRFVNGTIGSVVYLCEDYVDVLLESSNEIISVQKYTWLYYKYKYNKKARVIELETVGSFTQYPLKLAYALTIHKSQGLTLEKVVLDMRGAFASGQVYVALSRCKDLNGVILATRLWKKNVMVDVRILNFFKYRQIINIDEDNVTDMDYDSDLDESYDGEMLTLRITKASFERIRKGKKSTITREINEDTKELVCLKNTNSNLGVLRNTDCPYIPYKYKCLLLKSISLGQTIKVNVDSVGLKLTSDGSKWKIYYLISNPNLLD